MANLLFKRIRDWAKTITSFRTSDIIAVDGPNGTAKMDKDDLLRETAQNALAGNTAPKFDPNKPNDGNGYSYYAGTNVTYRGKNYVFIVNHSMGAWNPDEVEQKPLSESINVEGVGEAVNEWLNEHPEATTTVQDNSITDDKLAPAIKYNRTNVNSAYGYKLLSANTDIRLQMTEPNTIYEIRWTFDLAGETLQLPNNSVLKFAGGCLKNAAIVFNDTTIDASCFDIFDNCSFSGSLNNGSFELDWCKMSYVQDVHGDSVFLDSGTIISQILTLDTPVKVVLGYHDYLGTFTDCIMTPNSGIIGKGKNISKLRMYSSASSHFYLGLPKGSVIQDVYLWIYEDREIPIIYSDSIMVNSNSEWQQTIRNVEMSNWRYYAENPDEIKTIGIKFAVTPYDYQGVLHADLRSYAFSYRGDYDCITIKHFDQCIVLYVNDDVIPDFDTDKLWCTSVWFTNLVLWGRLGFVGVGKPMLRGVISECLYQSEQNLTSTPYPLYGIFKDLVVDNLIAWDCSYRGCVEGTIYDITPSLFNTNITDSGYKKLNDNGEMHIYNTSPYSSSVAIRGKQGSGFGAIYVSQLKRYSNGVALDVSASKDITESPDIRKVLRLNSDENGNFAQTVTYVLGGNYTRLVKEYTTGDIVDEIKGGYSLSTVRPIRINGKLFLESVPVLTDIPNNDTPIGGSIVRDGFYNRFAIVDGDKERLKYLDVSSAAGLISLDHVNSKEYFIGAIEDFPTSSNVQICVDYLITVSERDYVHGKFSFMPGAGSTGTIRHTILDFSLSRNYAILPFSLKVYVKDSAQNRISLNLYIAQKGNFDYSQQLYYSVKTYRNFHIGSQPLEDCINVVETDASYPFISSSALVNLQNGTAYGEQKMIKDKSPIWWNGTSWVRWDGENYAIRTNGTYAQKPTPTNIGFQYFNTDTNKMITWDGSSWRNPDGTVATN